MGVEIERKWLLDTVSGSEVLSVELRLRTLGIL